MNAHHHRWLFGGPRLFAALCAGAGVVSALSTGGCTKDPEIVERPLVIYSPKSCPISENDAYSVIYAGGDFEPSADRPPIASVFLRELGRSMQELPADTRSLVVDVSQRELDWRGVVDVPTRRGAINVLLWRTHEACRLTRDVERRTGMTLGIAGSQFIIAGGRSIDGPAVPHTFVGNLNTGGIERLQFGLNTRRLFSTITTFRGPNEVADASPALIAGGEDPDTGQAIDNAEIYVPKIGAPNDVGDFEREHIPLSRGRTRHASIVLPTGETLLIGGADESGGPLPSMEIVDPVSRRARTAGVALLANARTNPIAVKLANGEILVWAGLGDRGRIVQELEWILPDASDHSPKPSIPLVTGRERAIVPLEGGGALAVITPDFGDDEERKKFQTVWVISADGFVEPANPVDPLTLDTVRLFPGAEGAPVLWTGRRWLRWAPWSGAFQPIPEAPERGPSLGVEDGVPHTFLTADPGLALWLEDRREAGMSVSGFRFATRSRFDAVPKPLLVRGPDQLAPDRLAGGPNSSLRFDEKLGLVMGPGASAFLTDVSFADFELNVDVTGGSPTVVIRLVDSGTEYEVGGGGCPLSQTPTNHLFVRRKGLKMEVQVDDKPLRNCVNDLPSNAVRVSIGLRASTQATGRSSVKNLLVSRR